MRLLRSDVQATLKRLNGMLSVKGGRGWINWLLKVSYSLRGGMTGGIALAAVVAMRHFYKIYRHQGVKGLVLRTKALYVLTMQAYGGHIVPSQDLGPAIARNGSGLPRVIPKEHRMRIRNGEVFYLRLWLSWFSIYRVLTYPGKLKLNTITDPGKYLSNSFLLEFVRLLPGLFSRFGYATVGAALPHLPQVSILYLLKATPSFRRKGRKPSSSPMGILSSAWALLHSPVWGSFVALYQIMYQRDSSTDRGLGWTANLLKVIGEFQLCFRQNYPKDWDTERPVFTGDIGALGTKDEAAGKIRVFAFVDCWTQWLLRPLHLFLFSLLKKIEMDGTHDQIAPINRLISRGNNRFWCFDLSAATDRLPISLQSRILSFLFTENFGPHWAWLLVGRQYRAPKGSPTPYVTYAVGQPMGALSSWAMLALTHHVIVQWAARRVGYKPWEFTEYAVLGDDIVIANGKVAGAYLQLMETLGVGIGLAKSLISRKGVLEFAKRYIVRGQDCSPVPIKEMVAALVDFEYSTEFVTKYGLGKNSIVKFLGYGYRVSGRLSATFDKLPRRLSTLGKWRCSPWGSAPHNIASWLNICSFVIRPEWLVGVTEMWPELPALATQKVIDACKKELTKMDKVREDLPTSVTTLLKPKWLRDWFDTGLEGIAKKTLLDANLEGNPMKLYNGFWAIQYQYLLSILSPLKADLSKYSSLLGDIKNHSRGSLPEHQFLKWIAMKMALPQISKPALLHEVRKATAKPSPLYQARLYNSFKGLPDIRPEVRKIKFKASKKSKATGAKSPQPSTS